MKMKYVDIAVTVLFIAAMAIIYLYWKCDLDLYVAIIAGVIILAAGATTYVQYKKIKELQSDEEQEPDQDQQ